MSLVPAEVALDGPPHGFKVQATRKIEIPIFVGAKADMHYRRLSDFGFCPEDAYRSGSAGLGGKENHQRRRVEFPRHSLLKTETADAEQKLGGGAEAWRKPRP